MELLFFMAEPDPDEHVYAAGSQAYVAYRRSDDICPLKVNFDRNMDDLENVSPHQVGLVEIVGFHATAYLIKDRRKCQHFFLIQFDAYGIALFKKIDGLEIAPNTFIKKCLFKRCDTTHILIFPFKIA